MIIIYKNKKIETSAEFLPEFIEKMPFKIQTILTDNEMEYTFNLLAKQRKKNINLMKFVLNKKLNTNYKTTELFREMLKLFHISNQQTTTFGLFIEPTNPSFSKTLHRPPGVEWCSNTCVSKPN